MKCPSDYYYNTLRQDILSFCSNTVPDVHHIVCGVMLSNRNTNYLGAIEERIQSAVSCCEDVLVGDDGSFTRGGFAVRDAYKHDPDLPGILIDFRLSASDNPCRSVDLATVTVLNWLWLLWTIGKPWKY